MPESDNEKLNSPKKPESKEMSTEARLLLAFVLMGLVLFLTPYFLPKPPVTPKPVVKQGQPVKPDQAAAVKPPTPAEAPVTTPVDAATAQKEELFTVETQVYRVAFSNRGAVVHSWLLKNYKDASGKPLEVVNQLAVSKVYYPLSLWFKGQNPSTDINQALFVPKPTADGLGIDYEFSNGKTTARKSFRFEPKSYLVKVSSQVAEGTVGVPHLLTWRGGFGDEAVLNPYAGQHTIHYDLSANKLVVTDAKSAKDGPVTATGNFSFAGVEDAFFAAVFLPASGKQLELQSIADSIPTPADKTKEQPYVGAAVGGDASNNLTLFLGPKDVELLRKVDPKLENLVDFGWFSFLAKPLFLALNYVNDRFVHNYGWSIILVTIIINLLLLPLKLTSMKSMKKMSALQPQIAAINEKYKSISLRDPRKAEQNQEVMELYKKNGVNPAGGCVPLLLQIPFFIAFYKVLSVAIEMRGAQWLWVTDLSQPETIAIRVLPILMLVTQIGLQKMTPQTGTDPSQQKMMMLMMPLMMAFFFYGASSGLVLYWLTGNLVGLTQQWLINRSMPTPATQTTVTVKKKGSR